MKSSTAKPNPRNPRKHDRAQIQAIAKSIQSFGFNAPILVDKHGRVLAGHGRLEAAKFLELTHVPVICLEDLTEAQATAYMLADNKLALNAGWDQELLAIELQGLIAVDFDIEITGFSPTEIDLVLDEARESSPEASAEAEDQIPVPLDDPGSAVTRTGDVWWLGATA